MPGRSLSNEERSLGRFWTTPPSTFVSSMLRSIEVSGNLRGIDGIVIPFRYPLTAICGQNGVGKSTILALAALAHHTPNGWFVHWGNTGPSRSNGDRTYYTFSDFFVTGSSDRTHDGVVITWRYVKRGRETSLTFSKRAGVRGWGNYGKRPEREVDYIPLGRVLPAHEIKGMRSNFRATSGSARTILSAESRKRLSFVMGRRYSEAEVQQRGRYVFPECAAGPRYSGFNMGGGETSMIALMHLIQRMPEGGLLVIEEIESGLHPQAQVRLAQTLIGVCKKKRVQIVCSTHSGVFLDELPREARLLLKRTSDGHEVVEEPSTRFAMYEMLGSLQPELHVYCEDRAAHLIIEAALSPELRVRVVIVEVGSSRSVVKQGVAHARVMTSPALCVLDGDCSEQDGWINSEIEGNEDLRPQYVHLPGGVPPEVWAIQELQNDAYRAVFAHEFGCTEADAEDHIGAAAVVDHHDVGNCLQRRTNLDADDCLRRTMRSLRQHPQLEHVRVRVSEMLA